MKVIVQSLEKEIDAQANESILEAALRQGVLLPHGCREGFCGACKGRVLSGTVSYDQGVPPALTKEDLAAGEALLCQAKASSDLRLDVVGARLEQVAAVKNVLAKVDKLERLSYDVMRLVLKFPAATSFDYKAGQYLEVVLKNGGRRAFSMATMAIQDQRVELHVRKVVGGKFTPYVFDGMKEGDLLRVEGPYGAFMLRPLLWPAASENLKGRVFVAGGTGFAPIKALIESILADVKRGVQASSLSLYLYWGGRRQADIYEEALCEQWARQYSFIKFVPVLSEPEGPWRGRTGFVHEAVVADLPSLDGFQAYVSGPPLMVAAARRDFVAKCALSSSEFLSDAFEFSPQ